MLLTHIFYIINLFFILLKAASILISISGSRYSLIYYCMSISFLWWLHFHVTFFSYSWRWPDDWWTPHWLITYPSIAPIHSYIVQVVLLNCGWVYSIPIITVTLGGLDYWGLYRASRMRWCIWWWWMKRREDTLTSRTTGRANLGVWPINHFHKLTALEQKEQILIVL